MQHPDLFLWYREYKWAVISVQGAHIYLEIGLKAYSYTDLPKYQGLILKNMEVKEFNKIIFDLLHVCEKIVGL